ncbi:hypothetical protein AGDE_03465 [Angomonas deanei]|nr:WDprotein [Angomonas deanei]EPY31472.1 hypothetical protein AGDE_09035 [Angomonas deanei]EPY40463.1 hypothetical protein AGDE_03465 [Angomonas deanei]|eukprot:EPY26250.1 WDprotein [Angomonas deanei]
MNSVTFGLDTTARALCPLYHQQNGREDSKFLVGTDSASGENKIAILEYDDGMKTLDCVSMWESPKPIKGLWPSPSMTKNLFASRTSDEITIFSLGENILREPKRELSVERGGCQALWDLEGLQSEVTIRSHDAVFRVALDAGKEGKETCNYSFKDDTVHASALDPHHPYLCAAVCDSGMKIIDFRAKSVVGVPNTTNQHGFSSKYAIDFNPVTPNKFLTYGDDGQITYHDIRYEGSSYIVSEQSHFKAGDHQIKKALYNPFHQELIISCGSDQTLGLFEHKLQFSTLLSSVSEFGDTITDICWSNGSPWIFAGVSHSGKVIVSSVPSEVKMRILLGESK